MGLSVEQREMIRYWVYRSASQPVDIRDFKKEKKLQLQKTESARGRRAYRLQSQGAEFALGGADFMC